LKEFIYGTLHLPLVHLEASLQAYEVNKEIFSLVDVPKELTYGKTPFLDKERVCLLVIHRNFLRQDLNRLQYLEVHSRRLGNLFKGVCTGICCCGLCHSMH